MLARYLISGGDSALLLSDELPEDDPLTGAKELDAIVETHAATLLVGVTCGLSAPYVAGQLDYALRGPPPGDLSASGSPSGPPSGPLPGWCGAFVVGFNGVEDARDAPIELWGAGCDSGGCGGGGGGGRSFRDVARALEARAGDGDGDGDRAWFGVLNPVVGPEAIAGSSRMKGGTATHVLLDATCFVATCSATAASAAAASAATSALAEVPHASALRCAVRVRLEAHASAAKAAYSALPGLAGCMTAAAGAVRGGGRLCFLASHGGSGCMAFIDASEMPDT